MRGPSRYFRGRFSWLGVLLEPSLQSRALRSTCLKMCFLHSQVPLRLRSELQPTARLPGQLPSNSSGSWRQRATSTLHFQFGA